MSDRGRRSRRFLLSALAAALLSALPLAAGGENEECAKLCTEASAHSRAHEYEEAAACYKKAIAADPKSSRAQHGLGTALAHLAETTNEAKATWDEAIAAWEKVLKMEAPDPWDTAMVYADLGEAFSEKKKDPEKALGYYKAAVAVKPDYGEAWLVFARFQYSEKRYQEAQDCAKKALECGGLKDDGPREMEFIIELCKKALRDPAGASSVFAASFALPSLAGLATTSDLATLVVSVPTAAQLVYYDTAANKEAKRVSLELQPGRLAVQGKTLYVAARGTAKILALELESGKVEKTIKLPACLVELCCHRSKGLLYGATAAGEVLSVDPASGRVVTCQAKGSFVAIDPSKPSTVYTAAPSADPKKQADGTAVLRKYAVSGGDLKLADTNDDAALKLRGLDVTPDGKRVAAVGEGGSHDEAQQGLRPGVVAVFETGKLTTAAGQIDAKGSPRCLAFHPFLDMGVLVTDKGILQFASKSLACLHDWPLSPGPETKEPRLVAFVDGGKKVARWEPGDASKNGDGTLGFLSLVLTPDDLAALEKASKGR